MVTIENYSIAKKILNRISQLQDEEMMGMWMDKLMDESGECGNYIKDGWDKWMYLSIKGMLLKCDLTFNDLIMLSNDFANKELLHGTGIRFIGYSKKNGTYVTTSFLDTKYGSVYYRIVDVYSIPDPAKHIS